MTRRIPYMLMLLLLLFAPGLVLADSNPLIETLKEKGIVTEDEAGKLEQKLDTYYQKRFAEPAKAPAVPPQALPQPAAPAVPLADQVKKLEDKAKRDRVNWGGEARFRIMEEWGNGPSDGWAGSRIGLGSTPFYLDAADKEGFYNIKSVKPINAQRRDDRGLSFPLRLRLSWDAQVIPDWVDVWGRFTINKRWGTFSATPESDPFNAPNSFSASIGSEIALRAEQVYATVKVPHIPLDLTWYVGRLPGLDGPPSRQQRSIFPRVFIDSEIDGTLLKLGLPGLPGSDTRLGLSKCPLEGAPEDGLRGGPMGQFDAKLKDTSAFYIGYLDYQEAKLTSPAGKDGINLPGFVPIVGAGPSSDVLLGQVQIKLLKDTQLILDGLWMPNWYMPRQDFSKDGSFTQAVNPSYSPTGGDSGTGSWTPGLDVPFFTNDYALYGGYVDTQVAGIQLYGSLYFNHLEVPAFAYEVLLPRTDGTIARSAPVSYEGGKFDGYIWHVGLNSGAWLAKWNMAISCEYARGSDEWINPFNYRGYRRKGTVLYPEKNAFFGGNQVVGFYPFNAGCLDAYLDYVWGKAKFRAGVMYFEYDKHQDLATLTRTGDNSFTVTGGPGRIFGWSRYETQIWPYLEFNVGF